jgi:hypothetical protein
LSVAESKGVKEVKYFIAFFALAVAQGQTARPPSATEIFRLRTECAKLGNQLMEVEPSRYFSVTATDKENHSHYDPRSNRCYVELTAWAQNNHEFDRLLYDGQTRQMLAYTFNVIAEHRGGQILMVPWQKFADSLGLKRPAEVDFDFINELIGAAMADDRTP